MKSRRDYFAVKYWSQLQRINGASMTRIVTRLYRAEDRIGSRTWPEAGVTMAG
jgi:hypothetical protein